MHTWKIYQVWYCLFQYHTKQIKCIPTSTHRYTVILKTCWFHFFISERLHVIKHVSQPLAKKHAELRCFLHKHLKDFHMKLTQSDIYHRSIYTSKFTINMHKCIIFHIFIFHIFYDFKHFNLNGYSMPMSHLHIIW